MQPLIFLQNGEQGIIRRVGGAADTRRFLANLGFVEQAPVLCDFQIEWKYDCKYQRFQGSY